VKSPLRTVSRARLAAAALGAALIALRGAPAAASDLQHVKESHTLRVLTDLSDPNDVSRLIYRTESGYDGIEYQVLRSFARALGAQTEVVVVPSFDGIFPALARGDGDIACASITDTPERRRIVDLSDSYFPVRETVVVRRGDPARSFAALAGRRAITQRGTTWEKECLKAPKAKIQYTENQSDLFSKVADGTADFSVTDSPMAMTYASKYPNLEIAWSLPEKQNYAFALRLGSDLTPLLNANLKKLKETGAYYALLGRFYGQKGLAIIKASE
jgi:ABC-type amino acid transport substrate-binding protein